MAGGEFKLSVTITGSDGGKIDVDIPARWINPEKVVLGADPRDLEFEVENPLEQVLDIEGMQVTNPSPDKITATLTADFMTIGPNKSERNILQVEANGTLKPSDNITIQVSGTGKIAS